MHFSRYDQEFPTVLVCDTLKRTTYTRVLMSCFRYLWVIVSNFPSKPLFDAQRGKIIKCLTNKQKFEKSPKTTIQTFTVLVQYYQSNTVIII